MRNPPTRDQQSRVLVPKTSDHGRPEEGPARLPPCGEEEFLPAFSDITIKTSPILLIRSLNEAVEGFFSGKLVEISWFKKEGGRCCTSGNKTGPLPSEKAQGASVDKEARFIVRGRGWESVYLSRERLRKVGKDRAGIKLCINSSPSCQKGGGSEKHHHREGRKRKRA